jgi:hypothetical protein
MKAGFYTLIVLLLFFECNAIPQSIPDSLSKSKYKHYIGAAAGISTGYGMSYRYWPTRFGLQSTIGLFGTFTSNYEVLKSRYSLGMAFLYKVVDTQSLNLFLYQGNHYNYYRYTYYIDYREKIWYNGIGIGIEHCLDRLSLNLMGGFAAHESFKGFGLTAEVGLYYKL